MIRKVIPLGAALLLAASAIALPADKPALPEGPGKATTQKVCGSCHAAELLLNRRESREGWSAVVEDMIRRGTKASDDEFAEVIDYLAEYLSKKTPKNKIEN